MRGERGTKREGQRERGGQREREREREEREGQSERERARAREREAARWKLGRAQVGDLFGARLGGV